MEGVKHNILKDGYKIEKNGLHLSMAKYMICKAAKLGAVVAGTGLLYKRKYHHLDCVIM